MGKPSGLHLPFRRHIPLPSPCPQRFAVSSSLVSIYLFANPSHRSLSLPHILSVAVSPPLSSSEPAGCHTTHTACYMISWKTELRVFVATCCCSSLGRLQSRRQGKMPSRQPWLLSSSDAPLSPFLVSCPLTLYPIPSPLPLSRPSSLNPPRSPPHLAPSWQCSHVFIGFSLSLPCYPLPC